ncbi:MAG: extracellular solute-binding protein [Clostridiales bacterium]|nr:extracellular solute-binding protein [Clostridiales bacterium]
MRIKKILVLSIVLLLVLGFMGCAAENTAHEDYLEEKQSISVYLLFPDRLSRLFPIDFNRSFYSIYYKRRVWLQPTFFYDAKAMYDQILKEMYLGEGPDLIVINGTSSKYLNLNKLSQQDAFADMDILIENSETFDLNDYNSLAMDTGIINEKRIMIPMGYNVNSMIGLKECFQYHDIKIPEELTLTNYMDLIEEYYSKTSAPAWLGINEEYLLSQFIDIGEQIEKTDELKRLLDILQIEHNRKLNTYMIDFEHAEWPYNFINAHDYFYNKKLLFLGPVGQRERVHFRMFSMQYNTLENYWNRKVILFPQPIPVNEPTKAYVEYGFVINNNSKNKNEAFSFIEFVLSEIKQTTGSTIDFPVRKDSFETRKQEFEEGINVSYADSLGIGAYGIHPDFIPNEFVPKEIVKELTTYVESAEDFEYIGHYKFIYYNILQPSFEDYYEDFVTYDEMIDDINNKLKIYYNE